MGGKVRAGRLARRACERHLGDLETGHLRGLRWDPPAANRICRFAELLPHYKGRTDLIRLEAWQVFLLALLFGWRQDDGTRRFRTGYLEIARGNGKSTLLSVVLLYLLALDHEPGAEVYSAATKRDQARIVFDAAVQMVRRSPDFRDRYGVRTLRSAITQEATASSFVPLSSDFNTLDGLNGHGIGVDELHAHPSRALWDVLEGSTAKRRQPLIAAVTTAGFNAAGVCWELHTYGERILEGEEEDDSFFPLIYALDDPTQWQDEAAWVEANPCLGVSVSLDGLRRLAKKAAVLPGAQTTFLTKHCNLWLSGDETWMPLAKWDACDGPVDLGELAGRPVILGLDLANRVDVASGSALFPPLGLGEPWRARTWNWLPDAVVRERRHAEQAHWSAWSQQGFVTLQPGAVIQYPPIQDWVREMAQRFQLLACGYDPWGAPAVVQPLLAEGLPMVEVPMTVQNLSPAMKELEGWVFEGALAHGGDPALRWMTSNVRARIDHNGNLFPRRPNVLAKIDAAVALLLAVNRALVVPAAEATSIYDTERERIL